MKKILTYKGAVMTWETDSNRHMNVMYYVNKFEHAGRNFNLDLGLHKIIHQGEIGIVVLEQKLNYYREVFEDDLIYIESSVIDIGNKAYTLFHEMYNGKTKELVSTMRVVLTLFDQVERKAIVFPPLEKERLLKSIAPKS